MMQLVVTPRAARDFDDIYDFISQYDPIVAKQVTQRLVTALKLIAARPHVGRPAAQNRREWSVPKLPYVIPYRVAGDRVIVLRIFHTSRLRPPEW